VSASSRIARLPDTLVDQIAAGEVVERPASAVKELVENALDAGAKRIEIDLDGGGIARIVVSDDGSGMTREEAPLSLERHATSKIRSAADLAVVSSYGFRGEALPSIASVSHFTLLTSTGDGAEGTKVVVDGGRLVTVEPAARPRGTTMTLLDLFANVPARRKFLKGADAERRRGVAVAEALLLPRPEVALTIRTDGRESLVLPPRPTLEERILDAFGGHDALGKTVPIAFERHGVRVSGLVGTATFPTKRNQYLFVRSRWVTDRALQRAVARAEQDVLRTADRHAAIFLFLEPPPAEVDVNVHPAKSEVRFRDSGKIFEVVFAAVRNALLEAKGEAIVPVGRPGLGGRLLTGGASPPFRSREEWAGWSGVASPSPGELGESLPVEGAESISVPPPFSFLPEGAGELVPPFRGFPGGRFLGQFRDTYLLVDSGEALLLVDQHVAHERVLFEATLERLASGRLPAQRLLVPLVFTPTPSEGEILEEQAALLDQAGFELTPLSGGSWGLVTAPEILKGDPIAVLREMVGRAEPSCGGSFAPDTPFVEALAARLACRAAIMAGDPIGAAEARKLLEDLARTSDPWSCPHGRPSWIALDRSEVEKRFGRR
jgi:DNA mismatch repair protein MutL